MSQIFSNIAGTSIGGVIIGGTTGSVLFVGASGVIAQDNANFFWDSTTKALWIKDASDFNTKIGYQAGKNIVAGATANTFVGYQAGLSSVASSTNAADQNIGVGYQTLLVNTTGSSNNAFGYQALLSNTTGVSNVAIGSSALSANTTGTSNIGIGINANLGNTVGIYNVAVGANALATNSSSNSNTAVGVSALYLNTANANTAVGYLSLYTNSTGASNVSVGAYALQLNTTGAGNTAVGNAALQLNTTGGNNTAVGVGALAVVGTQGSNTAVGVSALGSNTGYSNTAMGIYAMGGGTGGSNNVAMGYGAAYSNAGTGNCAVGVEALYSVGAATGNCAFGISALRGNTSSGMSAFGYYALYSNTSGLYNNAFGYESLRLNTTGAYNTASGYQSLLSNTTGTYNTANGLQSLYSNTTGTYNTANGLQSLYFNTTGNYNTANGYLSGHGITGTGSNNTLLGASAGAASYDQITTGSNNISIGYDVAVPTATANYQLCIGNLIYGTALDGTGATLSTGSIGIGITVPTSKFHIRQTADSTNVATPVGFSVDSVGAAGELTAASGTQVFAAIKPIYNQTSTAAGTDLLINRTRTAVGSGAQRILDCQIGGVSGFSINDVGSVATVTWNSGGGVGNGGSVTAGLDFITSRYYVLPANRGYIAAPADGVIKLWDSAATSFGRLEFGGETSSFPSIKRNGAALNFRVADDTADCAITALKITTSTAATFHETSVALTDGAAAAVGTITNAPAAGNPTKWIGINDNGTTRYIPAW